MTSNCATVSRLTTVASAPPGVDRHLANAAGSALAIINDLRTGGMADADVACLYHLVAAIHEEGHDSLFEHLHRDSPDCLVCAALALAVSRQHRNV